MLRVLSFNIRYGVADDGDHHWLKRRGLVVDTIRQCDPDFLGVQEALRFQVEYLQQHLADYTMVGVGREDGRQQGEYAAIFFRIGRFQLVNSHTFWLSESPEQPGSKSWNSSQTRIVTWCELADRLNEEDQKLTCFNTHFDQRSDQARIESARLLRRRVSATDGPLVVMGDFNATEDELPYRILLEGEKDRAPRLIDAFRCVHPERTPYELTRHEFQGERRGSRIDWIVHSNDFVATDAQIVYPNRADVFASDHYPVTATLQPRAR